jgi:phosphoenolpyruvate phosphomutase
MCIEDKLFPKTNSFINGERQPLAEIDEFCGKIRAAKDTQDDPDFCVVARVEALIAGHGQAEAMRRAEAYCEAGADAVLIHSKRSTAEEIVTFMERWDGSCPVVIVPTTYYTTPVEVFGAAGVSVVIWANHLLRSSIAAMQRVAETLYKERMVEAVEQEVVSVEEVFRLQQADELEQAERRYLPVASDRAS